MALLWINKFISSWAEMANEVENKIKRNRTKKERKKERKKTNSSWTDSTVRMAGVGEEVGGGGRG